jgi:hypothetical protein
MHRSLSPTLNVTASGQRATRSRAQEQDWNIPNNNDWPIMKILTTQECIVPDHMLNLPPKNHTYIDSQGKLKDPYKYSWSRELPVDPKKPLKIHPTLVRHIKNGTATKFNRLWYEYMTTEAWSPIAGVITPESKEVEKEPPLVQLSSEDSETKNMELRSPSQEASATPTVVDLTVEQSTTPERRRLARTRRSVRTSGDIYSNIL